METLNNNTYNHIKELISKYLQARTTVGEEQILRDYFNQTEISADLEQYRSFFQDWDNLFNNSEKFPDDEIDIFKENSLIVKKKSSRNKSFKITISFITGIAASLILFFLIKPPASSSSYVLIDGIKYTDKESVNNAFKESLDNVHIDFEDMFSDFSDLDFED